MTRTTRTPKTPEVAARKSKTVALTDLLSRPEGATIEDMMAATGWQAHSVRGAIAGAIKKARGHDVVSEKTEAGRVYRVGAGTAA